MPRYTFKKINVVEEDFGEIFAETCDSESIRPGSSFCSAYGEGDSLRKPNGEQITIKSFTMTNSNRMEVKLITWGATIVSVKCPDKYGDVADVVLGFDDLKGYLDPTLNQFVGCVLGRCANRIRDGTFKLKGSDYVLTKNESKRHHLHGGTNGFGRRIWESHVDESCCVVMSYLSQDGEEGYPGAVLATLKFKLTNDNRLEISCRASTSKPTVVNLSHGSLFNLAGHCAGEAELRKHQILLNCDRWTVADSNDDPPIPIGTIRGVGGTIMDLRVPKLLGDVIDAVPGSKGFEHNFCVLARRSQPEVLFVARVFHEPSGRFLEVYSDQPGVQLYTAGRLPPYENTYITDTESSELSSYECGEECDCESEKPLEFIPGKCGAQYTKFAALSIQPQNYPDAVNVPHFPCAVLRPGQVYYHDLVYKLGVQLDSPECKIHC
ncbi:aldose 1-epimerase-like [Copidosoma floridanum]|uniref:aldose 1-epimerase-like n=1 Tax=Copidosoma floridanum TaxID=29053 RepID=UPI0006C9D495|nr:aldose 1-epimerase-like [Copidosoma floridanum]